MTRIFTMSILILMLASAYSLAEVGYGMMKQPGGGHMMGGSTQEGTTYKYISNGERIYSTGTSERAGRIPFRGGPMWLSMHGGGCASCHGSTGKGGVPVMMGTAVPKDIRYQSLTAEEHEHGGDKDKHPRYTDKLIKRAITDGLNPAGERLDWTMPRYKMTEEDLKDLVEFIKTLG